MIKGPWQYDERTGMVAVYAGERLNCLDGIGSHAIYSRSWTWNEGTGHYNQKDEDKEIGRLVAAAPELLNALCVARDIIHDYLTQWQQDNCQDDLGKIYDAIKLARGERGSRT